MRVSAQTIDSTEEARIQLSTLSSFDREKNDMYIGNFARLKELGEEIRVAKYKTDISEWAYEQPAAITALETQQEETFDALSKKSAHKKAVLDDDLVREELREQVCDDSVLKRARPWYRVYFYPVPFVLHRIRGGSDCRKGPWRN